MSAQEVFVRLFIAFFFLFSQTVFAAVNDKPQVGIKKMTLEKVRPSLLFPAIVKSRVESNIKADGEYIIVDIHTSLGAKVKKGDVLFKLKKQDPSLNFHPRFIKAPVNGVVADLSVAKGEYVSFGSQLALINNPSKLYLKVELPVENYTKVKPGLRVEVKGTTGKVSGVGAVIDSSIGTVPLEVSLTDMKGFVPGAIENIEIILNEEQKMILPESALYYSGDEVFVPTLVEGKVLKKPVKVSAFKSGQVEIIKGIEVGEEVVVRSGKFLKNGQEVKVEK